MHEEMRQILLNSSRGTVLMLSRKLVPWGSVFACEELMGRQELPLNAHQTHPEERGQRERAERFQQFKTKWCSHASFYLACRTCREIDGRVPEPWILSCLHSPLVNISHPPCVVDLFQVIQKPFQDLQHPGIYNKPSEVNPKHSNIEKHFSTSNIFLI